jgi:hypothetical protein
MGLETELVVKRAAGAWLVKKTAAGAEPELKVENRAGGRRSVAHEMSS